MRALNGVHKVMQVTVSYRYTAYMSKEPLRQYHLNLSLGRNKLHKQNIYIFFLNNFIYPPVSAGTAECVRRVIYAQPSLTYHFPVQTKLQSLTKRTSDYDEFKGAPQPVQKYMSSNF